MNITQESIEYIMTETYISLNSEIFRKVFQAGQYMEKF